jgi:hypothetical protein
VSAAERIAGAARALVEQLDAEQRAAACLPFDEDERRYWTYFPAPHPGVALWALDRDQAKAAHRLLSVLLTEPAFARAVAIMALEEVLDLSEGYSGGRRHREDYWVAFFGEPGSRDQGRPWGVRVEGHHVSVHATVVDEEVRLTPLFLGAHPAVVADDADSPLVAPLQPEERLGFDLLHALPADARAAALVSGTAPADILTGNLARLDRPLPDEGVPLAALTGGAAAAARALLAVYLGRFPDGVRRPDPDGAAFAWAGAAEPGIGHYYRIGGARLLIELDNTQNGANHVHTVVRDPASDFGEDLLAGHLVADHPLADGRRRPDDTSGGGPGT